jgi:hypothetical protein
MKKIIVGALLLVSPYIYSSEFMITGPIIRDGNFLGVQVISHQRFLYASDRQDYVSGGLTFDYGGIWDKIPRVVATVELTNTASATDTYTAVISANSASSTTILVYKISAGGGVVEAASGEVKVAIFAVQNPYPLF